MSHPKDKEGLIEKLKECLENKKPIHWFYQVKTWRDHSKRFRLQNPVCRVCEDWYKRTTLATLVDHVIPVRERPELAFTNVNLQSLCKDCHKQKSLLERRRIKGPLFKQKYLKYQDRSQWIKNRREETIKNK